MCEGCGCDVQSRVQALLGDGTTQFVMATVDPDGKPRMRWMGAFARDPRNRWVLYCASFSGARKMKQIAANPNMQLLFASPDFTEVATLIGTAQAEAALAAKQIVWNAIPGLAQYFTSAEGEDFGLIRFTTTSIELLATEERMEPYFAEV